MDHREIYRGIIFSLLLFTLSRTRSSVSSCFAETVPFSNNSKLLRILSYRSETILAATRLLWGWKMRVQHSLDQLWIIPKVRAWEHKLHWPLSGSGKWWTCIWWNKYCNEESKNSQTLSGINRKMTRQWEISFFDIVILYTLKHWSRKIICKWTLIDSRSFFSLEMKSISTVHTELRWLSHTCSPALLLF